MADFRNLTVGVAAGLAFMGLASSAFAGGSIKDAPEDTGRKFGFSWNIGATTDYVFRGFSQTAEDPTVQGGVDVTYGILYAGAWASGVDFGEGPRGDVANLEVDVYGGIKPVWGKFTFDFGVIGYLYPGARDAGLAAGEVPEQDYFEIKAGVSVSPIDKLTLGTTVFYSPEYTGGQGEVWTVEGGAAYEFAKVWIFTPTLSALLGSSFGDANDGFFSGNGDDSYLYWNAGVSLAVDKLTLDFRYWDTNVDNSGALANFCTGPTFQCDERFVFTAKITF